MNLLEKLDELPRRGLFFFYIFLVTIPLLYPFPIPVPITQHTRNAYEVIDNLEPGSIVLYDMDFMTRDIELYPMNLAAMYQIVFENDAKVIIYSTKEYGPIPAIWILDETGVTENKVYGEDYVHLGFVPGLDVTMQSFVLDMTATLKYDHYGNELVDLPIFDEVNTIEDVDLIVITGGGHEYFTWARIGIIPYDIDAICLAPGSISGQLFEQLNLGVFDGGVLTQRGAAEYEMLLGRPGIALSTFAPLWLVYVVEILLILIGNVAYLYKRRLRGD